MAYQLQISPSVGKKWAYILEKALVKLGRANHCDIVINDQLVSREHCQLQIKSEGLFIEDLKSVNGTMVNGRLITRVLLQQGDKIRLGVSEITVNIIPGKEIPPSTLATRAKVLKPIPAKEPEPIPAVESKPSHDKEPEPIRIKKPEVVPPKESEPIKAKELEPIPAKEPEPFSVKESKPTLDKEPELIAAKKPEPSPPKESVPKIPKIEKPQPVRVTEPVEPETPKVKHPEVQKPPEKQEAPAAQKAELEIIPLVSKNQPPPSLLVIHPDCSQIESLLTPLEDSGVIIQRASDKKQVQSAIQTTPADCVLLCSQTEGVLDICQEVKSNSQTGPIVLLAQKESWEDHFPLLQAGVDEVLCQPDPTELQIRLRNMLELHRLRQEATSLNSQLEKRVSADVSEAERITRLKRYLSPQVVAAVLSGKESHVLKPIRQEVSIVFSDLRNYTHFSEMSEPEEIISMLSDFHALYGEIIFQFDGTLERFAGDGVMVFFGAPVPFKDHAARAVAMAVAARERLVDLRNKWKKLGYALDISFGISTGYVYVGNIGFEGRMDYAAIGKTTNLAARLCAAAKGGEILISRRTLFQVEDLVEVQETGGLEVKGFSEPVMAYNVLRLKEPYTPIPVE